MKSPLTWLSLCTFAGLGVAQTTEGTLDSLTLEAREHQAVSQHLGVAASRFDDADLRVVHYRGIDRKITLAKATLDDGTVLSGAWDEEGRPVDVNALRKQELAERTRRPETKIQPLLAQRLAAAPAKKQQAMVWLAFDGDELDRFAIKTLGADRPNRSEADAERLEAEVGAFVQQKMGALTQQRAALLRQRGIQVTRVSTSSPLLFIEADSAEMLAVAGLAEVDTLYAPVMRDDHNWNAAFSHRTTNVWGDADYGDNRRVAVLENNGIDPACPWLNVSGWYNAGSPNPDNHVHGTAGCIAALAWDRLGSAFAVDLYSANSASYSTDDLIDASDWIARSNIDLTNMSYGGNNGGSEQELDRYYDFQSRYYQDSYVASAGNDGNSFVGSPGTSWNVLTVGCFAGMGNSDWSDDVMASYSSWWNPSNGCEKPNIAAYGDCVKTLGDANNGWFTECYSGTSFSAPHAAANLALVMNEDTSALVSPEAAMAAMMASAWHNIEGSSRLSAVDGAGGIHAQAAVEMAQANRIRYVYLSPSSFSNNGYYTYNMYLTGGDRTRVCIAWSANANSSYTTTDLDADLDLAIYRGYNQTSGSYFGGSSSWNNNFEIVEFTPSTTDWYTIRINDYRYDGSSERVGIAWTQRNADNGY